MQRTHPLPRGGTDRIQVQFESKNRSVSGGVIEYLDINNVETGKNQ